MLNKTKIIIAAASVLITGIGAGTGAYIATRNNDTAASVSSEVISVASSKTESIDTSPIDGAVSAGVEKINEAASKAIQQIESKAGQQSKASSAAASSEALPPKPRSVSISKEVETVNGTLKFHTFETVPDEGFVWLRFTQALKADAFPDIRRTILTDANGHTYHTNTFGWSGADGGVRFHGVSDFFGLSTLTVQLALEGYDPVTVTFDIPLQ